VLYTRPGCGLCEQAHELLLSYGFEPKLVDIDQHPELIAAYGECVPVVTLNGKLRFRGRVNKSLLLRLLR
jgi:glutaredoxin